MNNRKPTPLYEAPARKQCPVCGETSYSSAGIHPQCAVRQLDEVRLKLIKRNESAKVTTKSPHSIQPWQKTCPECEIPQHVRKKVCDCGHTFAIRARSPTSESE